MVINPDGQSATLTNGFTVNVANLVTWTGSAGDGQWNTAGNWNPAQVPTTVSNVVIDMNTTVTATNAAISFTSLTLGDSSGTSSPILVLSTTTAAAGLVVVNPNATWEHSIASPISVASMTVQSGGVLTQVFSGATNTEVAKLNLAVTNTFNLHSGANIPSRTWLGGGGGTYSRGFGPEAAGQR